MYLSYQSKQNNFLMSKWFNYGIVFSSFFLVLNSINGQYTPVNDLLDSYVSQNSINSNDLNDWYLSSEHISNTSQIRHSYIYQRFNGIEVYNSMLSFHETQDGVLLHANNQIIERLTNKINVTTPTLSHIDAISAFANLQNYDTSNFPSQITDSGSSDQKRIFNGGTISKNDIKIKLMYVPISNTSVRLAYDFDILETNASDWWSVKIDAVDGSILSQVNWTVSCNHLFEGNSRYGDVHNCKHHSCSSEKPKENLNLNTDSYRVFPIHVESPSHGGRTLEVNPADLTASPYGWHDTDGVSGAEYTITRGNNVLAQDDENGNNGSGYSPDGTSSLDFDFTIDFDQAPTNNRDAALTNLFYWNNIIHDVWYHNGFDEVAGNFQDNNYGKGGQDNDYVLADGLDGEGLNNANMSVPPDGSKPRMQMFLWSAAGTATSTVNNPTQIEGAFEVAPAAFGDENFSITDDIVIADDGSASPTEGCNAFTNASTMNGKIALIDRGNCQFGTKALNAENAGAKGAIICNNIAGPIFNMSPGTNGASVTIPVVMMSQQDCDTLKNYLPSPGINITLDGSNNGIEIDGDFDNGIIVHEYGHGISIRLSGGPNNSNCLGNEEQMGEGWSDWFGLMMTIDSTDTKNDLRGIGTYVKGQTNSGSGIRTYPYSADTTVNPFTYSDISGVSVPHGVGSVWATMLWDLSWAFIDIYGYDSDLINGTGGNNKVMEIVIEAIKLQPCSPGFIDGRDAILDADDALFGGTHACIIWETFAARGLGYSASQGSTSSVNDGSEGFDVPIDCELSFTKYADVDTISSGGIINYTIKVLNNSSSDFTNLIVEDSILDYVSYISGSANLSGSLMSGKLIWPSTTLNGNDSLEYTYQLKVDSTLLSPTYSIYDDVENGNTLWETSSQPIQGQIWAEVTNNPYAGSKSWFANNIDMTNRQELILSNEILVTDSSELTFHHFFNTEIEADGGKVLVSTDDGNSWIDLGSSITQFAYNSFIFNDPDNTGFSGKSGGYKESIVDLSAYSGDYLKVKFSFYTDPQNAAYGWNIDDINLSNLKKEVRNTACMTSNESEKLYASATPVQILAPTCNDGIQNGDETEIDCGGSTCQICSSCPTNETYTGTQASTNYQVSDTINSTVVVGATDSITYQANHIELNNGFEVVIGGEFLGEIAPCTPLTSGVVEMGLVKIKEVTFRNNVWSPELEIPEDGYYDIKIKKSDGTFINLVPERTYLEKGPKIFDLEIEANEIDAQYFLISEKFDEK